MAAGAIVFPYKAILNMVTAAESLNASAANYRLAFIGSAWTPVDATDEIFSVASANEIAATGGYTAGGIALPSAALSISGATVMFTCSAISVVASGGGLPAWRRGLFYWLGTLNGKVNPIIGHFLGDGSNIDVPVTTAGVTLRVTPDAAGIVSIHS